VSPVRASTATHAGIPWLRFLRQQAGDRTHFWPFDGWEVPAGKSVVAEVYPALWSKGLPREERTSDQHDAHSVAAWMHRADLDRSLLGFFDPCIPQQQDRGAAGVEGWILGVV